jgi:hypothetical protein
MPFDLHREVRLLEKIQPADAVAGEGETIGLGRAVGELHHQTGAILRLRTGRTHTRPTRHRNEKGDEDQRNYLM